MICVRQGLRKYKYKDKHKDKYKDIYKYKYNNSLQTYDVICFWKGDDKRSLIMKNVQNVQNMQNMQNCKICKICEICSSFHCFNLTLREALIASRCMWILYPPLPPFPQSSSKQTVTKYFAAFNFSNE